MDIATTVKKKKKKKEKELYSVRHELPDMRKASENVFGIMDVMSFTVTFCCNLLKADR